MTTPYTHPSRLHQKSLERGIVLNKAGYQELLPLYHATIKGIYEELYNEDLDKLAINEDFVRVLASDVREIVKGLSTIALEGLMDVIDISSHLEKAQVELSVAVMLFDNIEEPNAIRRIRGRAQGLKNFRRALHKVIMYWPREWGDKRP